MRTEIRDALENARQPLGGGAFSPPTRRMSVGNIRAVIYSFLQEIDSDLTVAELCDELCINSVQHEDAHDQG